MMRGHDPGDGRQRMSEGPGIARQIVRPLNASGIDGSRDSSEVASGRVRT